MTKENKTQNESTLLPLLFRHHLWANLRLFEACQSLSDEQLQHVSAGTFGSIQATIAHIVRAEERYLYFLDDYKSPDRVGEEMPIENIIERAKQSGKALQRVAESKTAGATVLIDSDPFPEELPAEVLLLQALHHGSEHRTHIASIMGVLGLEPPSVSGWEYNDLVLAQS